MQDNKTQSKNGKNRIIKLIESLSTDRLSKVIEAQPKVETLSRDPRQARLQRNRNIAKRARERKKTYIRLLEQKYRECQQQLTKAKEQLQLVETASAKMQSSINQKEQLSNHLTLLKKTLRAVAEAQRVTQTEALSVVDSFCKKYGPNNQFWCKKLNSLMKRLQQIVQPEYLPLLCKQHPKMREQSIRLVQLLGQLRELMDQLKSVGGKVSQALQVLRQKLPAHSLCMVIFMVSMNMGEPWSLSSHLTEIELGSFKVYRD